MKLAAFDTHAHLDLPQFDADREAVIERAMNVGVRIINTIGIDLEASRQSIRLAEQYPFIFASIGIHPQEAGKTEKKDIDELTELAKHPRVIAIGELGLDFYHGDVPREAQLKVLNWELELAKKVGLPVIIHCREAQKYLLPVIRDWAGSYQPSGSKRKGVLHCFSADLLTAEQYLKMGFYISVGGYLGYPSSKPLRETIKNIPLERLVVETDCPFLPPQRFRGQRNEPSYILDTLIVLAEIKGLSLEEIVQQTTQNAIELFHVLV